MASKRERLATALDRGEMREFRQVQKFVRSFCGEASAAETLRRLVCNWSVVAGFEIEPAGR